MKFFVAFCLMVGAAVDAAPADMMPMGAMGSEKGMMMNEGSNSRGGMGPPKQMNPMQKRAMQMQPNQMGGQGMAMGSSNQAQNSMPNMQGMSGDSSMQKPGMGSMNSGPSMMMAQQPQPGMMSQQQGGKAMDMMGSPTMQREGQQMPEGTMPRGGKMSMPMDGAETPSMGSKQDSSGIQKRSAPMNKMPEMESEQLMGGRMGGLQNMAAMGMPKPAMAQNSATGMTMSGQPMNMPAMSSGMSSNMNQPAGGMN